MGKKTVDPIEKGISIFTDIMKRCDIHNVYQENGKLLSDNQDFKILVIPDKSLWEIILEKNLLPIIENMPSELCKYFSYADEENWIPIEIDDEFLKGRMIEIKIDSYEYFVNLNRDLMALKLKKAEYNNISYKIYLGKVNILALRKRFDSEYGFSIIRLFKIV